MKIVLSFVISIGIWVLCGCKKKAHQAPPPIEVSTLNDGLVLYYPFSNNFQDIAGNSLANFKNATFTINAQGKTNSAIELNGADSWVLVMPNNTIKNAPIFSISLKFFQQTINTSQRLFYWGLDNNNFSNTKAEIYFSSVPNQSNTFFSVTNPVYCNSTDAVVAGINTETTLNTWHSLTGIYNGSSAKIYIDGVVKDEQVKNLSGATSCTDNRVIILGSPSTSYYTGFTGKIDELRIYNRVLTDKEILQLSFFKD